ncbi:M56 family metallopeptidase [Corallococcus coralloides]|uniref:M56 family metallopeptidase n=1 Tax=Corallococcus coralloides TaxID=184914 RepID=UPI00384C908A
MMAALAFLLECAAVAAVVGVLTSLLVGLFLLLPTTGLRPRPAFRADVVFLLGTLPLQAALAVVAAAAAPSLGAWVGLGHDHCQSHGHHLHLCILHASGLRPALAVGGALALAAFLFRLGGRILDACRTHTRLTALEAMGSPSQGVFPVVAVPGMPRLCHAAGAFRRRILLSSSLEKALAPEALRAALAHEEAHLRRRDPLAVVLLSFAGLFMPPPVARAFASAYRAAAEEACDAEAALAVGDATVVAEALVKMATLQRSAFTAPHVLAFGMLALERRVRHLLEGETHWVAPSRALLLSASAGLGMFAFALLHTHFLHHAVETALHLFS